MQFVLDNERFCAGFTHRQGGVSVGAYKGLNLGDHVGDEPRNVAQNRQILADRFGVSADSLKFMSQIHSSRVEILKTKEQILPPCDGVITDLRGVVLCVLVADCSPVLIIDDVRGVVAAIHAGRAGVMSKICTNALNLMASKFGSKARDLRVFVGANIKGSCYEVGDMDLGELNVYKNGKKFDMNAALSEEFRAFGVSSVEFERACTHCDERHFSYRRDGVTGRFAGFVMIK